MRILHYTLGLPPMRSGGLTRYAVDLMKEQSNNIEVVHLYPGKVDFINKQTRIAKNNTISCMISHFEIINSLPLPLFRGIREPNDFMRSVSKEIYREFLHKINPDVIHIHTLMGLHKEFLESAKELKIKLVYTTHDYFGICPTINLYKDKENINCSNFENGNGCLECCYNSLGTKTLLWAQTPVYPMLKQLKKLIPTKKVGGELEKVDFEIKKIDKGIFNDYISLREFYLDMLRKIDVFHFNSILSMQVFKEYLPEIVGKVINITHSGIKKRVTQRTKDGKIRIGYLGPLKEYKGFFTLLDTFKQMSSDQYELHLFGDNTKLDAPNNVFLHGRYSLDELDDIFKKIDVIVVPSLWKETFGFVTLEGLSYNTPVIVSENVGSKDLVKEEYGWRFNPNSLSELLKILSTLNKETLHEKHLNIKNKFKVITLEEHSRNIRDLIYFNDGVSKKKG